MPNCHVLQIRKTVQVERIKSMFFPGVDTMCLPKEYPSEESGDAPSECDIGMSLHS